MPELLWIVPVFTASIAGTLVLGFYLKGFSSYIDPIGLDCLFIRSYFTEILSQILLIVRVLLSSSNLSSILYTMVWNSSDKFDRI